MATAPTFLVTLLHLELGCCMDFSLKSGEIVTQLRIIRPSVPVVVPREEWGVDYSSREYNATICKRSILLNLETSLIHYQTGR